MSNPPIMSMQFQQGIWSKLEAQQVTQNMQMTKQQPFHYNAHQLEFH